VQAYIMTGGGPGDTTRTLEYYIFNNLFEWGKVGYASSIAWFVFVLVFIVTIISWRYGGKLVHY
jgi:multiple sugar transport system permease protein